MKENYSQWDTMFENRVDKDKISSFLKDQLNTLFKNRRFPNISWKMYSPFNSLSGRVANIQNVYEWGAFSRENTAKFSEYAFVTQQNISIIGQEIGVSCPDICTSSWIRLEWWVGGVVSQENWVFTDTSLFSNYVHLYLEFKCTVN